MNKNIIKEIIIILLLALAIILILGVLLYEYIPANKIVPEKVSYTTPENVKTELQTDSNIDDTQVVVSYEIDGTDLNNYKKTKDYVPGKKNPFSSLTEENQNTTTDNGTKQNGNTVNGNTSTEQTTNTGYIPDKGTK